MYITFEALYVVSLFEAIPLPSCDVDTSSITVKTTAI